MGQIASQTILITGLIQEVNRRRDQELKFKNFTAEEYLDQLMADCFAAENPTV